MGPSIGDHISAAFSGSKSGASADLNTASGAVPGRKRSLADTPANDDDDVTSRQTSRPSAAAAAAAVNGHGSATAAANGHSAESKHGRSGTTSAGTGDESADNALELARLRLTQDKGSELPHAATNGLHASSPPNPPSPFGRPAGSSANEDPLAAPRRSVRSLSDPLGARMDCQRLLESQAAAEATREGSSNSAPAGASPASDVGSSLTRLLRLNDAPQSAAADSSTFLRRGLGLKLQPAPPSQQPSASESGAFAAALKHAASAPDSSEQQKRQQASMNGIPASAGNSSTHTSGPASADTGGIGSTATGADGPRKIVPADVAAAMDAEGLKRQKALARLLLSRDRKVSACC